MTHPLTMIFQAVINFALLIVFLRFMFQFAEIEKTHPYAKVTYMLSAVVTMFRRIFPDLDKGRISSSAIVLMLLLVYINIAGIASIRGEHLGALQLFFLGTLSAILKFVTMLRYIVLGSVILSWVIMFSNKIHPVMDIIMQMAEPIITPFRRVTPNLGMLDLSPLMALLSLSLIELFIGIVGERILQMII